MQLQCINPLKAGFDRAGSITYSSKKADPGQVGFQFECRKCLPCRLNIAREKSIRAFHESQMHENNIFLTLTYDDDHLESYRLIYEHFQKFMQDLRDFVGYDDKSKKISYMVTGEYGEKNKRPHWHALIFNWAPSDPDLKYTTERGDRVFRSKTVDSLWSRGAAEFGNVTLDSASYVARYAAKKLVHGRDQAHDYHPIHKTSKGRAIGRSWIEKYWKHTFENGFVVLPNGELSKIPRYYVDWLKKQMPDLYFHYVTEVRPKIHQAVQNKQRKEELEYLSQVLTRPNPLEYPITRAKVKETILKSKFKRLQEKLKL